MITKTEYLKALDIVEKYHLQLRGVINKHKPPLNDIGLKRNDYVIYIGGSESKLLTKGKEYRLTSPPYRDRIRIINDKGTATNCRQVNFTTKQKL